MNPPPAPRAAQTGRSLRMCPQCRQPLLDGEFHINADQCVKSCKRFISSLHDALLQNSLRFARLKADADEMRGLLFNVAHQSGGAFLVKERGPIEGHAVLERKISPDDESVVILTATIKPLEPKPS